MNLFGVLEISASALLAERQRAEVVTSNLANLETTRTPAGGPYRRQEVIFGAVPASAFDADPADWAAAGVRVQAVVEDTAPALRRYEPGHPDADPQGYVAYPAIDPVVEMADLMGAARAYELNATAAQATKNMIEASMDLLQ